MVIKPSLPIPRPEPEFNAGCSNLALCQLNVSVNASSSRYRHKQCRLHAGTDFAGRHHAPPFGADDARRGVVCGNESDLRLSFSGCTRLIRP
jgi:hypothetical protein